MKRRIFSLTVLFLLMLGITAQAIEPRATGGNPVLTFDGTTAECSVTCTGNKSSDQVEATLTLYHGDSYVDSWNATMTPTRGTDGLSADWLFEAEQY